MALKQRCVMGAAIAMLASTALGAPNAAAAFGSCLPKHETISDTAKICAPGRFGMPCILPDNLRARIIEPAIFYAERRGELREFIEKTIAKYSRHLDLNHVWIGQNHNLGLWGAIRFENEKTSGLTVASVKLTITINFYGKNPTTRS